MIVKIENLDHNGRGITRVNNKITFIKNALSGEIVDIKIIKEKKNYNEGEVVHLIEKSKNRIIPKCPYYNECGGCDLMHMDYSFQLKFKEEKVKNILKKYANLEPQIEIYPSNKEFNYRNKITLHEQNKKVGFMKKSSNEILEIKECKIADEKINEYIKKLNTKVKEELIIRTNEKGDIISSLDNKPLIIKINDLNFYIDINSFFQVNSYICSLIFNFILENITKVNCCLDLYSGVGALSLVASLKANKVYGIEVNEYSYKNALKNLELNKINNVKFTHGKVEEKIKDIKESIDLIITDPPRTGMDMNTIKVIKEYKPKDIIYMSCDPMTLARDLSHLKDIYELRKLAIFDMFPNTKHVECVCVLNRG